MLLEYGLDDHGSFSSLCTVLEHGLDDHVSW